MMPVDPVLLSPGKTLTDPLLLLLAAALIFLTITWRRARGHRAPLAYAIATLMLLALLSTDAATRAVESTLIPRQPPTDDRQPDLIVVPSGGSTRGLSAEYDVLNESSHTRVVAAALWWRRHRAARLILTGADQKTPGGASTRTLELMRDTALRLGVPASAITLDAQSFNTREHAQRIAALPGITRTTRIGLVTSAWHMRRARLAFTRRFVTVIPHPVPGSPSPLILNDFLPSSAALRNTTRLLHEWLGIAWYALRR